MSVTREPGAVRPAADIEYPESDGTPMGETDVHRWQTMYFIEALDEFFRDREAYVSGDIMLYFEEGEPRKNVSPDVLLAFGLPRGDRRVYKVWEEGKMPEFVIEVTSRKTRREDERHKPELYARLGVQEMWLVDPLAEYLAAPFRGYQREAGAWKEIPATGGCARSALLGLDFCARPEGVRLVHPATGDVLPSARELADQLRERDERLRERDERLRERDAEVAALRAELERLRRQSG